MCRRRFSRTRSRGASEGEKGRKDKDLLGHHINLVWEDPKIVPPDIYFNAEGLLIV